MSNSVELSSPFQFSSSQTPSIYWLTTMPRTKKKEESDQEVDDNIEHEEDDDDDDVDENCVHDPFP